MNDYRTNSKPRKIIYLDVSSVDLKDLKGFMDGVRAAFKAMETQESQTIINILWDLLVVHLENVKLIICISSLGLQWTNKEN